MQAFFAGFWPTEPPLLSPTERAVYEKKLAAWEAKTAEVRTAIEKMEEPHRVKVQAKERSRFPEEYARLIDVPFEKRAPLEKQIGDAVPEAMFDVAVCVR